MALLYLSATSALAYPDQIYVVLKCTTLTMQPDNGLQVRILTGGIAGLTEIQTMRSLFTGAKNESFSVKQLPMDPRKMGAPMIYQGKDVTFSINMTTSPRPDGTRLGTLVTKQHGTETLKCSRK